MPWRPNGVGSAAVLQTLADTGLCRIIANSIQRHVGDGVAYESDEDFHLSTICVIVTMYAFMHWAELNAAGGPTAIRNAIDSAIGPQANTPEELKFEQCLMFDRLFVCVRDGGAWHISVCFVLFSVVFCVFWVRKAFWISEGLRPIKDRKRGNVVALGDLRPWLSAPQGSHEGLCA